MVKKHVKKEEEKAEVLEPKSEKKTEGFSVLDSNGKIVRTVDTREKAEVLAKVYGGRVK